MINGVTPSGARAVQLTHLAHFRRLQQIESHHPTPQSDPDLLQALRTRRHNHVPPSHIQQHSRRLRQYSTAHPTQPRPSSSHGKTKPIVKNYNGSGWAAASTVLNAEYVPVDTAGLQRLRRP